MSDRLSEVLAALYEKLRRVTVEHGGSQNGLIFFQNDKPNFIAAREIVIEFVF